jgi:hypothetical protein
MLAVMGALRYLAVGASWFEQDLSSDFPKQYGVQRVRSTFEWMLRRYQRADLFCRVEIETALHDPVAHAWILALRSIV